MQNPKRKKQERGKLVHLSPVPSETQPMSPQARRYGDLERTELAPGLVRIFLYGMIGAIAAAAVWACVAEIDVVSSAPATVVPQGLVKFVQPERDGVIQSVAVKEGQTVKAGDVLVVLEPTADSKEVEKRQADLDIAKQRLEVVNRALATIRAAIERPGTVIGEAIDENGSAAAIADLNLAQADLRESELDAQANQRMASEMSGIISQRTNLQAQRQMQEQALKERTAECAAKITQKSIEIEQLKKALESAKVELEQLKIIKNATQEKERSIAYILKEGAVSKVDHLNMVIELQRSINAVTKQEATVAELTKRVGIAEAQLAELQSQSRASGLEHKANIHVISAEMGKVDVLSRSATRKYSLALKAYQSALARARAKADQIAASVNEQESRVKQADAELQRVSHILGRSTLTAPIDGTVTGIRMRGKGQVVSRGERLLSVVPAGQSLVLEAAIPNKDAGFVEAGQTVKIKLSPYPFEDFGIIQGKVQHVEAAAEPMAAAATSGQTALPAASPAVAAATQGMPPTVPNASFGGQPGVSPQAQAGPVYIARIIPDRQSIMARGRERRLVSGMTATCEIVTRRRTVLSILLEPVRQMQETRWQ